VERARVPGDNRRRAPAPVRVTTRPTEEGSACPSPAWTQDERHEELASLPSASLVRLVVGAGLLGASICCTRPAVHSWAFRRGCVRGDSAAKARALCYWEPVPGRPGAHFGYISLLTSFSDRCRRTCWLECTWSERFAPHPEDPRYPCNTGRPGRPAPDSRFNTPGLVAAEYDESDRPLVVRTDAGAGSPANVPESRRSAASRRLNLPVLPAAGHFRGDWPHTGLWHRHVGCGLHRQRAWP